jgi:hypothetical protein
MTFYKHKSDKDSTTALMRSTRILQLDASKSAKCGSPVNFITYARREKPLTCAGSMSWRT